jgi:hypothetical protein
MRLRNADLPSPPFDSMMTAEIELIHEEARETVHIQRFGG